jgi:hypothetical protein
MLLPSPPWTTNLLLLLVRCSVARFFSTCRTSSISILFPNLRFEACMYVRWGRFAESNPDLLLRIHKGLNPGLADCTRCYGTAAHICCKKLLLRSVVVILSCLFPGISRIVVHGAGQRMFLVYHGKALVEGGASTLPSMEQILLLPLRSSTLF